MPTSNPGTTPRAERVRREGFKLIALSAITVLSFFTTRAVAERMRVENRTDAATWQEQGDRAFMRGDIERAADAYRQALLRDRANSRYALSLATALQRENQLAAAERILLALREQSPDSPEINLQLARIAGRRDEQAAAIRYYSNALYGAWTDSAGPRQVRFELIEFLLEHDLRERALAEIVAARGNTPETADAHVQMADLLRRAGDPRSALDEFEHALRLAPSDARALAGAGEAAFAIRDYSTAARELKRVTSLDPRLREIRDVASLVVTRDPLAPHLGPGERRRRLDADLDDIRQRLAACMVQSSPIAATPLSRRLDQDAMEDAIERIARAEDRIAHECAMATPLDRALAIIAGQHTGGAG